MKDPRPRRIRTTVSIDLDVFDVVEAAALNERTTFSAMVRRLLLDAVKNSRVAALSAGMPAQSRELA